MLLGMGMFLYEQLDESEKMNEPPLPPRDAFLSQLNNEPSNEADYPRATMSGKHSTAPHCNSTGSST